MQEPDQPSQQPYKDYFTMKMKIMRSVGSATLLVIAGGAALDANAAVVIYSVSGSLNALSSQNSFNTVAPGTNVWTVAPNVTPAGGAPTPPTGATNQGLGTLQVSGTITFDDANPNSTVTSLVLNQVGSMTRYINAGSNATPALFSTQEYITYSGFSWNLGSTANVANVSGAGPALLQASGTAACASNAGGCGNTTAYSHAWINSNGADANQSLLNFAGHPINFGIAFGTVVAPGDNGVDFAFAGVGTGDLVSLALKSISGGSSIVFHSYGYSNASLTLGAQVPAPAAIWLLGSALGVLGVCRRGRKVLPS